MRPSPTRSASALIVLALLGACKSQPPANEAAAIESPWDITEIPADEDAAANMSGRANGHFGGALIPPAPGEPGGLPDDRRPLEEGATKDPASVAASGATIELFGLALSDGRYGDAYRFWAKNGQQSGMSEAQFADAYRRYSEIHVLVGRPEARGAQTVRVPVQIYGRVRDGGKPFNLYGMMTLARNPAGQNGEAGQPPWLITGSDLKPLGEVKISGASVAAPAYLIPVNFRGRWSETQASCAKPGDMSRLTVSADTLVFYESEGKVISVRVIGPDEIRMNARYTGEGEPWTRTSSLRLSTSGQTLTLDGMKRVRCLA